MKKIDAFWLAFFFVFSTPYLFTSFAFYSAYLTQIVGATFLLLTLIEFFGHKRWFVIGIFIALAGAARNNLFLALVFFAIIIVITDKKYKKILMDLSKLLLPVILVVIILGYYNFLRFGSFFNNGYFYDHKIIKLGIDRIFDWKNIPMQLYYFLYKPPHFISRFPYIMSDLCGHSILLTSPVLILIYFRFKKNLTNIIEKISPKLASWGEHG